MAQLTLTRPAVPARGVADDVVQRFGMKVVQPRAGVNAVSGVPLVVSRTEVSRIEIHDLASVAVSPRLAIQRLMLLDAVLTTPDVEWVTTAAEKAAYLTRLIASAAGATQQTSSPEAASTRTVALSGTLPIGVESDERTVLLYLATEVSTDTFRTFLQGHAAPLRVAPTWTLRIVFPPPARSRLQRLSTSHQ